MILQSYKDKILTHELGVQGQVQTWGGWGGGP